MSKTVNQLLAEMEAEDAAKVREWMLPEFKESNRKFESIADMITHVTPQWQTLPGGFWEWRNLYNKYSYHSYKMFGIYEQDPYPGQNFQKFRGIPELHLRSGS